MLLLHLLSICARMWSILVFSNMPAKCIVPPWQWWSNTGHCVLAFWTHTAGTLQALASLHASVHASMSMCTQQRQLRQTCRVQALTAEGHGSRLKASASCSAGSCRAGQQQKASLKAVPLLQPTLALLDKFGPYFSVEYHAELLAALEGLLKAPKLPLALRLSCLCSASAMTSYAQMS